MHFFLMMILCFFSFQGCRSYFLIQDNEKVLFGPKLKNILPEKRDDQKKVAFLGFLTYILPGAMVLPPAAAKIICYIVPKRNPKRICKPNDDDEICNWTLKNRQQEKVYAKYFQISQNHNRCEMAGGSIAWSYVLFYEFRNASPGQSFIDPDNQNFRKFANLFFDEYGVQSVHEFATVFQLTEEGKILNRQANADYYVIGKFLPVERELTWLGYLTYYTTLIPYVLTLGMIPSVEQNKITPYYYIFDKSFNQVALYHYPSNYWLVSTIWNMDVNYPSKPDEWKIPANHYLNFTPSVLEFKKDLAKFCEVNKC